MSTNFTRISSRMGPSGVISKTASTLSENLPGQITTLLKPVLSVSLPYRIARLPLPKTRSHSLLLLVNSLLAISMYSSISPSPVLSVGCTLLSRNSSRVMGATVKIPLQSNIHSGVTDIFTPITHIVMLQKFAIIVRRSLDDNDLVSRAIRDG